MRPPWWLWWMFGLATMRLLVWEWVFDTLPWLACVVIGMGWLLAFALAIPWTPDQFWYGLLLASCYSLGGRLVGFLVFLWMRRPRDGR